MTDKAEAKATRIQKRQKPPQAENGELRLSTNLLFREVGRKLAAMQPAKTISRTLAYDRLWKELRAGQLIAGFFIETCWIEIPSGFWQGQDSDRLKDLLSHKKGKLKLYPAELADVIIDGLKRPEARQLNHLQLRFLLGNSKKGFEPEITEASWSNFLERNGLPDKPAHQTPSKATGGNKQSERWRDVAEFILGFCTARTSMIRSKTTLLQDVLAVSQKIGLDTSGWPQESSLRDFITRGLDLGDKIKQHYPKA